MSLGQEIVAGKENEIVAIPRLLNLICIKNSIVTIDAMGCQVAIAKKIRENQADYILQVKNKQKTLLENIEDTFAVKKIVSIAKNINTKKDFIEIMEPILFAKI